MTNREKLAQAFAATLGLSRTTPFDSLTYQGIPEWDSVAHMQLVNAIETVFDIMLPTEDVIGMSSFVKACEILAKHGIPIDA